METCRLKLVVFQPARLASCTKGDRWKLLTTFGWQVELLPSFAATYLNFIPTYPTVSEMLRARKNLRSTNLWFRLSQEILKTKSLSPVTLEEKTRFFAYLVSKLRGAIVFVLRLGASYEFFFWRDHVKQSGDKSNNFRDMIFVLRCFIDDGNLPLPFSPLHKLASCSSASSKWVSHKTCGRILRLTFGYYESVIIPIHVINGR